MQIIQQGKVSFDIQLSLELAHKRQRRATVVGGSTSRQTAENVVFRTERRNTVLGDLTEMKITSYV